MPRKRSGTFDIDIPPPRPRFDLSASWAIRCSIAPALYVQLMGASELILLTRVHPKPDPRRNLVTRGLRMISLLWNQRRISSS
jgi:hypothetical protein